MFNSVLAVQLHILFSINFSALMGFLDYIENGSAVNVDMTQTLSKTR